MKSFLRSAISVLTDRILGPEEQFVQGDICVVRRSHVTPGGGTILVGSRVEVMDAVDPHGRIQVRIVDLPDYDWGDRLSRLPYGSGFIIYVDPDILKRE